jgi:DNA (cytosine-5)-methyltransferase 1
VTQLVLSLFPGIGLLDMAFEEEGFCIVRGPDLLWGGDIKRFHPPTGKFDGVIGGPPCQAFSPLNQAGRKGLQPLAENLIPEFERIVAAAASAWFLMENVREAPSPVVPGYQVASCLLNNRWLGEEQNRVRRFSFGADDVDGFGLALESSHAVFENPARAGCFTANGTQWEPAVKGRHGGRSRSERTWKEVKRGIRLQGLPDTFLEHLPFTVDGAMRAIGNGVPLAMGRAVARAVKEAIGMSSIHGAANANNKEE